MMSRIVKVILLLLLFSLFYLLMNYTSKIIKVEVESAYAVDRLTWYQNHKDKATQKELDRLLLKSLKKKNAPGCYLRVESKHRHRKCERWQRRSYLQWVIRMHDKEKRRYLKDWSK